MAGAGCSQGKQDLKKCLQAAAKTDSKEYSFVVILFECLYNMLFVFDENIFNCVM